MLNRMVAYHLYDMGKSYGSVQYVKAIAARDFHVATETGKGSPYSALVYVALVR